MKPVIQKKLAGIREITKAGLKPTIWVIAKNLSEEQAFLREEFQFGKRVVSVGYCRVANRNGSCPDARLNFFGLPVLRLIELYASRRFMGEDYEHDKYV